MSKLKTIFFVLAIVALLLTVGAIWFSKATGISFSWWSAQLSGMKTIESHQYQINASGQDLRAYSFIDAHGRYCTTVFASSTGSGLDCDFKKE
jgi:outer membrane lipoprotein-sorting protein